MTVSTNNGSGRPAPRWISGHRLSRKIHNGGIPAAIALRLAREMTTGEVGVFKLTCPQACHVVGVSRTALAAERRMHRPAKTRPTNGKSSRRVLYRRAVTDSDVDRIVGTIGAEKILGAVDRLTAPAI
jgi:hypothetical protein